MFHKHLDHQFVSIFSLFAITLDLAFGHLFLRLFSILNHPPSPVGIRPNRWNAEKQLVDINIFIYVLQLFIQSDSLRLLIKFSHNSAINRTEIWLFCWKEICFMRLFLCHRHIAMMYVCCMCYLKKLHLGRTCVFILVHFKFRVEWIVLFF